MYYVKVENGRVVAGPFPITDERTAAPNSEWKEEQMKKNGFAIVDLSCGPDEAVDYANPVISDGSVSFPRILKPLQPPQPPKTQEELDVEQAAQDARDAEVLIQVKIRTLAIEQLKSEGKLDNAGAITVDGKAEVVAIKEAAASLESANGKPISVKPGEDIVP